jgi:hypothetical protein
MGLKYIEATRAAQGILSSVFPEMRIDGHWGSFTQSLYVKAPISIQMAVRGALSTFAVTPDQLANDFAKDKANGNLDKARALKERNAVMRPDVQEAIANASRVTGVNSSVILGFAKLESSLNPDATNPKNPVGTKGSRGLMQMQYASWNEAKTYLKNKFNTDIGSYVSAWMSPKDNALAGAAYLLINTERLKAYGYMGPLTPAVYYLAHQQGAGGFIELWRSSQDRVVKTSYVKDEAMLKNPPPDGQGPTTSKKDFFLRWMAIAEKRIT